MGSTLERARVFLLPIVLLLSSCATICSWRAQLAPEEPKTLPSYPRPAENVAHFDLDAPTAKVPVWIEGPALRAVYVALSDLAARNGAPNSGDPLSECLARFDAYDVQIVSDEGDTWVVFVQTKESRCWDGGGGRLKDASSRYVVDKKDFRILAMETGG